MVYEYLKDIKYRNSEENNNEVTDYYRRKSMISPTNGPPNGIFESIKKVTPVEGDLSKSITNSQSHD